MSLTLHGVSLRDHYDYPIYFLAFLLKFSMNGVIRFARNRPTAALCPITLHCARQLQAKITRALRTFHRYVAFYRIPPLLINISMSGRHLQKHSGCCFFPETPAGCV